ncbi:MAG: bifunctional phosphoribosyl-AMP cyclohydrolase/phosphoribosyl-ATP diphosphatase HisIE [Bacteroidetes bacterium]|nr:bifunctional phosphoribosyl-AMP cyclohydrolase/phosphoribosyl-ATP diphosphatase HisIE [Bacteroidota bacterium]
MKPDFEKMNGIIPAVVQDYTTGRVLMLGFMNGEALQKTLETGYVTFYSRSKKRLWTKGETSGNKLILKQVLTDCDNDTLLLKVSPEGPVCHTGADTCFGEENRSDYGFLRQLEKIIHDRRENPVEGSYTSMLFKEGIDRIACKVGEEAVETVIEAKNDSDSRLLEESADLFYHLMVLLASRNLCIGDVIEILGERYDDRQTK